MPSGSVYLLPILHFPPLAIFPIRLSVHTDEVMGYMLPATVGGRGFRFSILSIAGCILHFRLDKVFYIFAAPESTMFDVSDPMRISMDKRYEKLP